MGNSLELEAKEEDYDAGDQTDVPSRARPRDMCLEQLARYDGEHDCGSYIAINGDIFDITAEDDTSVCLEPYMEYIGRNKKGVSEDELDVFHERYRYLGRVIKSRSVTLEELSEANGEDGNPIWIAARGLVFDMTENGEEFYGVDGGYHILAGRNAQRALALVSLKECDVENTSLDGLSDDELEALDNWIKKYYDKYTMIGTLEE